MIYGGVDPGKTGAMALIDSKRVFVYDYQDEETLKVLKAMTWNRDAFFLVEGQHAFPAQGSMSGFKLGVNYGRWLERLEVLGFNYAVVDAKKWQHYFFTLYEVKGLTTKKASLQVARLLFPQLRKELRRQKDHNRADSLLIAEYCRLVYEGVVTP